MGRRVRRKTEHRQHTDPVPHDPRQRPLQRLAEHVDALVGDPPARPGRQRHTGLLEQLEHPKMQKRVVGETGGKASGKPTSRILIDPGLHDLAGAVRQDALFFAYTSGWNGIGADKALRLLPDLYRDAEPDAIRAVVRQLGKHVHAAYIALGYRQRATHYPDARCDRCQQNSVWCREEEYRGWCANEVCPGDPDTGDRREWSRFELMALIRAYDPAAAAADGLALEAS